MEGYNMKRLELVLLCILCLLALSGCTPTEVQDAKQQVELLQYEATKLQNQNDVLRTERQELRDEIALLEGLRDDTISQSDVAYIITLSIRQSHYTLDMEQWLKDAINETELTIPVSQEFYYSVEVGDVINNDFRYGSFLIYNSFGSWKVSVKSKQILTATGSSAN